MEEKIHDKYREKCPCQYDMNSIESLEKEKHDKYEKYPSEESSLYELLDIPTLRDIGHIELFYLRTGEFLEIEYISISWSC